MKYYIGIDLGGTTVKLGLFEENGTVLEKWEIPTRTEDEGSHVLPDIVNSIEEIIKELCLFDVVCQALLVDSQIDHVSFLPF